MKKRKIPQKGYTVSEKFCLFKGKGKKNKTKQTKITHTHKNKKEPKKPHYKQTHKNTSGHSTPSMPHENNIPHLSHFRNGKTLEIQGKREINQNHGTDILGSENWRDGTDFQI